MTCGGRQDTNGAAALVAHQEGDEAYDSLTHQLFVTLNDGQLHHAPLRKPKFALDVGCGSGIWAVEFARRYPSCQVVGIDLNPGITPHDVVNCTFMKADIHRAWDWLADQRFDFIQIRCLVGFVDSWPDLLEKASLYLAPDGWLEVSDLEYEPGSDDGSHWQATGLMQFSSIVHETLRHMGTRIETTASLTSMMTAAGLRNTTHRTRQLPLGEWSGGSEAPLAEVSSRFYELDATIISQRGVRPMLNMSEEEARALLTSALQDLRDPRIHAHRLGYMVSGQKQNVPSAVEDC